MKKYKCSIDNAIILAAGYSSRFVPVCFDLPKGLLPVRGNTLIERQIRQLKERHIHNIYVITGAHNEKFNFLKDKYGIEIIFNPDYATKNNFSSVYAARHILANSIITSCDLFFPSNIFQNFIDYPYYAAVYCEGKTDQRVLTLDQHDKIIKTRYGGKNAWITFGGHACFTKEISQKIIRYMAQEYDNPASANKYWVDFQDEHLSELPMHIKRLSFNDIIEFNSIQALRQFDASFRVANISPTMKYLCTKLKAEDECELESFEPLKNENEIMGCTFVFRGKAYQYNNHNKFLQQI